MLLADKYVLLHGGFSMSVLGLADTKPHDNIWNPVLLLLCADTIPLILSQLNPQKVHIAVRFELHLPHRDIGAYAEQSTTIPLAALPFCQAFCPSGADSFALLTQAHIFRPLLPQSITLALNTSPCRFAPGSPATLAESPILRRQITLCHQKCMKFAFHPLGAAVSPVPASIPVLQETPIYSVL